MTIQQAYPSVNDMECSWADLKATFSIHEGSLLETADFSGIKWDRKVELGERRGASGGRVMARTRGKGSQNASASLYRGAYLRLLRALMAKAPTRGNQRIISVVAFDIMVQHTPIGSAEIYETKIKGCRFLGDADDMAEGNEADVIEVTLNPIEIANIIDGQEVVLI